MITILTFLLQNNCLLKGALQANLSFDYLLILHDFSKDAVTGSQQDSDDTTGIKFPFDSESRTSEFGIPHIANTADAI